MFHSFPEERAKVIVRPKTRQMILLTLRDLLSISDYSSVSRLRAGRFLSQYSLQLCFHSISVNSILKFPVVSRGVISLIQALYASTDGSLGRAKVALLTN